MASEIEGFLFGNQGTHALTDLSLSVDQVAVAVAPWTDLTCITKVVFERATLLSVWASSDGVPEDVTLPWDIIDFSSTIQSDGRWKFALYCGIVELAFVADFPQSSKT
ncbi:hypothetical protein LEP3755_52910 [Leptolyngbya sp. NIES-3755]|nr:hypothetical protein LEP3755_52910 [Leptolyngbya sp. NIES-3755]